MPKSQALRESVPIAGRLVEITSEALDISLDDLSREVTEIGSQQTWLGIMTARARRRCNDAKLEREVTKATIGREKRASFDARGLKITERTIEEEVLLDPRYQEAERAYNQALETVEIVESAKYAMVGKGTILAALAPLIVEERRADLFQEPPTKTRKGD